MKQEHEGNRRNGQRVSKYEHLKSKSQISFNSEKAQKAELSQLLTKQNNEHKELDNRIKKLNTKNLRV